MENNKQKSFSDDLFEQMANITKAHAYDIVSDSAQYWEKRCRAAEGLLNSVSIGQECGNYDTTLLSEWKKLKDQEFKRLLPK